MGGAVKDFKKSMKDDEGTVQVNLQEPRTLEHQNTSSNATSNIKN